MLHILVQRAGVQVAWQRALSPADGDAYDRFVAAAADGHYAQTRAWGRVAVAGRRLATEYFLLRQEDRVIGAAQLLRPSVAGLLAPAAWVERGPVCDDPENLPQVLDALVTAARRAGVVHLKVMPYWAGDRVAEVERILTRAGFRSVQTPDSAHAVTLTREIGDRSDAELLAGGANEKLRGLLRRADKQGATALRGDRRHLSILKRLYDPLMTGQGKSTRPDAFYTRLAEQILDERGALFVCEQAGEPLAAMLCVRHGARATYVMGAATSAPRTFSKMGPALMAAIRWARDSGCRVFDVGGVPADDDHDPKRIAIAAFKQEFASTRVSLVGEHARWLWRP
jgi:lipid II:glycine glycyltransferase (peptidoglycan interpeptide bridge formation enzyme)